MRRREFLSTTLALATAGLAVRAQAAETPAAEQRGLRILILGGTRFLGPHVAEYALARGHTLTFFNRGKTNPGVLPQVERIEGDRNGQLGGLEGRRWDAVIDNSGYIPRHVRLSAALLRESVPHYLFISSVSVYAGFTQPNDEASPVGKLADATVETVDGATYGPLKALCEEAVVAAYGADASTVIRPGLIVGPGDNTDRFTWWPARAARGGDFAAPGVPADPVQFVDVRDLAAFTVQAIERRVAGTFNVLSPPGQWTIGNVVEQSAAAAQRIAAPATPPRPVWIPADFLAAQKVAAWSDMPVWAPSTGEEAAFAQTSAARALAAGLTIRPLEGTVADTLRWHLDRPEAERGALKAGLSPEREAALLEAWRRKP
jgi:2'-hydroxyisoflavone reductase